MAKEPIDPKIKALRTAVFDWATILRKPIIIADWQIEERIFEHVRKRAPGANTVRKNYSDIRAMWVSVILTDSLDRLLDAMDVFEKPTEFLVLLPGNVVEETLTIKEILERLQKFITDEIVPMNTEVRWHILSSATPDQRRGEFELGNKRFDAPKAGAKSELNTAVIAAMEPPARARNKESFRDASLHMFNELVPVLVKRQRAEANRLGTGDVPQQTIPDGGIWGTRSVPANRGTRVDLVAISTVAKYILKQVVASHKAPRIVMGDSALRGAKGAVATQPLDPSVEGIMKTAINNARPKLYSALEELQAQAEPNRDIRDPYKLQIIIPHVPIGSTLVSWWWNLHVPTKNHLLKRATLRWIELPKISGQWHQFAQLWTPTQLWEASPEAAENARTAVVDRVSKSLTPFLPWFSPVTKVLLGKSFNDNFVGNLETPLKAAHLVIPNPRRGDAVKAPTRFLWNELNLARIDHATLVKSQEDNVHKRSSLLLEREAKDEDEDFEGDSDSEEEARNADIVKKLSKEFDKDGRKLKKAAKKILEIELKIVATRAVNNSEIEEDLVLQDLKYEQSYVNDALNNLELKKTLLMRGATTEFEPTEGFIIRPLVEFAIDLPGNKSSQPQRNPVNEPHHQGPQQDPNSGPHSHREAEIRKGSIGLPMPEYASCNEESDYIPWWKR